ncbi:hypothetical protein CIHG_09415 [Coccidioides immitis H538.4]|uniref:Uncharacterized protein n=1 Tax=Coccidioides immitis H538.4 TaxID=396776 RepID=A0A0J8S2Q2_COCIT|nr:hypothetical protein CIHG_09415 [Coccidioides immitis H538.4]
MLIEGLIHAKVSQCTPKEIWQHIGEDAVRVVHVVANCGVLKCNIMVRNFILR